MVRNESHPSATSYDDISREDRRRLTAQLWAEVPHAGREERSALIDEIILLNVCVARSIAGRYRDRGIALEDLEQVAQAALVRAAHHYDPERGDFLSYVVPSIRGELRRHFRDHGWVVRPPRRLQELRPLVWAESDRQTATGETPTGRSIADQLGVPAEEVMDVLAMQGCFVPRSLDVTVGDNDDLRLADLLEDPTSGDGEAAAEARVMLRPAIDRLKPRDQQVLRMRFFEQLTQREIADSLGVTQTQVSRLLARILRDLRRSIDSEDEPATSAPRRVSGGHTTEIAATG
ncbi:sigma-70 family RNA polymerase sigma factor [Nocardioides caeni]|uniref:Sigma-70 family RNA polymerase sigma factor n=1 Tax=Nocardioides caeni TaxID=574700 RepID=A0A4S8N4F8_9ACTN|nr:sigma-70 family RNA polymerase sigma factor [Nocardioides caeni]THV10482.1 sigma-70 family RNA polymerase sigma factor [Nocardioides caeni]